MQQKKERLLTGYDMMCVFTTQREFFNKFRHADHQMKKSSSSMNGPKLLIDILFKT